MLVKTFLVLILSILTNYCWYWRVVWRTEPVLPLNLFHTPCFGINSRWILASIRLRFEGKKSVNLWALVFTPWTGRLTSQFCVVLNVVFLKPFVFSKNGVNELTHLSKAIYFFNLNIWIKNCSKNKNYKMPMANSPMKS